MKLDLSVPAINVICHALQALQQQTVVVLEQITQQANAQQQAETPAPPSVENLPALTPT
jgi:hypothetical protein